jgi:hypothetical protein
MAKLYDLYCPNCETEYIDEWVYDNNFRDCAVCGCKTKPAIRCRSFELKYNPKTDMCSWADQGYSSSMYWSEVKKARDRGEKVKGANEQ